MDPTGQSLLKLLFNEGEEICVSSSQFAYESIPLEKVLNGKITLVSNNESVAPYHCDSSELLLCSINPIKGNRCDNNVTAFRSFLIELDVGDIKTQLGTIEYLKLPFSIQVFSGNRSVHTVITLDEDLKDEKTYRLIGSWIFNIITLADKNCANPSRSVRIPGAYREGTKKQRLIRLNRRITQKELMDWLNKYPHLRPQIKPPRKKVLTGEADFGNLSPWARIMLTKGIDYKDRGRNLTWYSLAMDLALAGFIEDQAIEILGKHFEEERDFKEKEWLTTIGSAFKKVSEGK